MRLNLSLLTLSLAAAVPACSWSTFDDLANTMWVNSIDKPDVGSSDYGVGLIGASTGTSGGRVAVLGNDVPGYSTLHYDAHGGVSVGPNPQKLGQHFISALADQPILITDGTGRIALVNAAIDANQVEVGIGDADTIADAPFAGAPPQDAVFARTSGSTPANLIVAAGPNVYTLDGTTPSDTTKTKTCTVFAATGSTAAAIGIDDQTLWLWTTTGALVGYHLSPTLANCTVSTSGTPTTPDVTGPTSAFAPIAGSKMYVIGSSTDAHEWAILAGHDTMGHGAVSVVDLKALAPVGTAISADGLRTSAFSTVGAAGSTTMMIALGYPAREINGTSGGQVELYSFDTTTGALSTAPIALLNDAQPSDAELFGRALGFDSFNGATILVVGASNKVFTYFRTLLYAETRQ